MAADSAKPDGDSGKSQAARKPKVRKSQAHEETIAFQADSPASQTHSEAAKSAAESDAELSRLVEQPETFGRYEIQKLLGHGGMGSVYLAHDTQLDRPVALKMPRIEGDASGVLIERLFREARAVATLNHPNICPVFDVGEHEGKHFIAMGYIEGRPLSDYIAAGKPQPERQVARVVRKVALALNEAHEKGILHRDLKPGNIMIDKRGEPIVMDFGLACKVDNDANMETRLTQDGTIVGTPAYMAPEQIDARAPVGPAADIYALGVVLYELLTCRCPFEGTVVSVIGQVLHNEPPAIANQREGISSAIVDICNRALLKDPANRYESMKDFAIALTAFIKGEAVDTEIALQPLPESQQDRLATIDTTVAPAITTASDEEANVQLARFKKEVNKKPNYVPWAIGAAGFVALSLVGYLIAVSIGGSHDGDKTAAKNDEEVAVDDEKDKPRKGPSLPALPELRLPRQPEFPLPELPDDPFSEHRGDDDDDDDDDDQRDDRRAFRDGRPLFIGRDGRRVDRNPPQNLDELEDRFDNADLNEDGWLEEDEFPAHIIRRADGNGDHVLSFKEFRRGFEREGPSLFDPPDRRFRERRRFDRDEDFRDE